MFHAFVSSDTSKLPWKLFTAPPGKEAESLGGYLLTLNEKAINDVLKDPVFINFGDREWKSQKHWVTVMTFFGEAVRICQARVMALKKALPADATE